MGRRFVAAVLLTFIASVPLDQVPIEDGASVSVALAFAFVPVALLAVVTRGTLRRITPAHLALVGFVAWAALSSIWSADPDATVRRAGTYAQLLVFVLLVWQLVGAERDVDLLGFAYVAGCAVAAVWTILNALLEREYVQAGRYAADPFDPNDLGVTLAVGIPIAWHFGARATGWRRFAAYAYVPTAVLGVAMTGSRGAAITTLIAVSIIPLSSPRAGVRSVATWAIVGLVSMAAVIYFVPEATWNRLLTTRDELTRGTMTERTVIWSAGIRMFGDHWLVGVGAGMFAYTLETMMNWRIVAHNAFMSVAAEMGIVGLVLFIAPVAYAVRGSRRCGRHDRWFTRVLLATWATGATGLSWEYRKTTWFVFTLAMLVVFRALRPAAEGFAANGGLQEALASRHAKVPSMPRPETT